MHRSNAAAATATSAGLRFSKNSRGSYSRYDGANTAATNAVAARTGSRRGRSQKAGARGVPRVVRWLAAAATSNVTAMFTARNQTSARVAPLTRKAAVLTAASRDRWLPAFHESTARARQGAPGRDPTRHRRVTTG